MQDPKQCFDLQMVELEDEVLCGPSMVFTNVNNPRAFIERKSEFRKTQIKLGATLGANCTIVCGHTIGAFAFIGAGAVVTSDIPDHALVLGVPGKIAAWVCACGGVISRESSSKAMVGFVFPQCGTSYQLEGVGFSPSPSSIGPLPNLPGARKIGR